MQSKDENGAVVKRVSWALFLSFDWEVREWAAKAYNRGKYASWFLALAAAREDKELRDFHLVVTFSTGAYKARKPSDDSDGRPVDSSLTGGADDEPAPPPWRARRGKKKPQGGGRGRTDR